MFPHAQKVYRKSSGQWPDFIRYQYFIRYIGTFKLSVPNTAHYATLILSVKGKYIIITKITQKITEMPVANFCFVHITFLTTYFKYCAAKNHPEKVHRVLNMEKDNLNTTVLEHWESAERFEVQSSRVQALCVHTVLSLCLTPENNCFTLFHTE